MRSAAAPSGAAVFFSTGLRPALASAAWTRHDREPGSLLPAMLRCLIEQLREFMAGSILGADECGPVISDCTGSIGAARSSGMPTGSANGNRHGRGSEPAEFPRAPTGSGPVRISSVAQCSIPLANPLPDRRPQLLARKGRQACGTAACPPQISVPVVKKHASVGIRPPRCRTDRYPERGRCSESCRDLALNLVHREHHEQYDPEDKHERRRTKHRKMPLRIRPGVFAPLVDHQ